MGSGCLLRAPLVLKNTAQKFLIHKTFWWCRNICPEPCPGTFYQYFRGGAALSFFGAGRGSVEIFRGRGGPGQPFLPGAGRGGAGRASLLCTHIPYQKNILYLNDAEMSFGIYFRLLSDFATITFQLLASVSINICWRIREYFLMGEIAGVCGKYSQSRSILHLEQQWGSVAVGSEAPLTQKWDKVLW